MRSNALDVAKVTVECVMERASRSMGSRGALAMLAAQLGMMPEVRRVCCEFENREHYPERPMITLRERSPSVYLLGWRECDWTEVHDHGACEVGVYVMQGMVIEDVYTTMRRSSRSSTLEVLLVHSRLLAAGQMITCPQRYLHRVGNPFPEIAATLHVYGPELSDMRTYEDRVEHLVQKEVWTAAKECEPMCANDQYGQKAQMA